MTRLRKHAQIFLDIDVLNEHGSRSVLSLPSSIEEVWHDHSFLVKMPEYQGACHPLPEDKIFRMYFVAEDENSRISELLSMPVGLAERIEHRETVFTRIKPYGKPEAIQRRDCYRLSHAMPVSLKRLAMEDMQSASARSINFSDGGMLLATNENLDANETIDLSFHTVRHETVQSVVIRTEQMQHGIYEFKTAVKFVNVSKEQKARFYRFIWEKQLEKRQGIMQPRR